MGPVVTLRPVDQNVVAVAPLRAVHAPAGHQYRIARKALGGTAKRLFDATAAAAALILLTPFFLLIALFVRLETRGPALYRQQRTGFRGRTFTILKFRTMRVMEASARVQQAQRDDGRVTRVGRVLRRCSLDELPQLFNVL